MNWQEELSRVARYFVPTVFAYLVGRGVIPQDMQQPLTELGLSLVAAAVAWFSSIRRDQKRK